MADITSGTYGKFDSPVVVISLATYQTLLARSDLLSKYETSLLDLVKDFDNIPDVDSIGA